MLDAMSNPSAPTVPRKTALITGASSGIGEASARALAAAGYDVALLARRSELLELCAKNVQELGVRAFPIVADLADRSPGLGILFPDKYFKFNTDENLKLGRVVGKGLKQLRTISTGNV